MLTHSDKEAKSGFILPFTTSSTKKFKDLTKNMELAAILYLAESERKKRESRILRKTDEKLVFVAKAFYPIWLVPYRGATLIFDGRNYTSHTLFYDRIPDIKTFNKNIRNSLKATESHTATLIRNKDNFKNFNGKEEIKIEGLIANSELIEDLKIYLHKTKKTKRHLKNKTVLANKIEDNEIRKSIGQLLNLRKRTAEDIQTIENSMRLLSKITVRKIKRVRTEINKIQNKHRKQIERIKPRVKKKIWRIQSKYNQEIARKSRKFKKEIQRLHENRIELQEILNRLKTEARRCKMKIRSKRRARKIQWNLKLKRIEKKLPTIGKRISANVKRARKVESDLRLEISPVVLPPEKWLEFNSDNVSMVPETSGVYQLLDKKKIIIYIVGAPNLRQALKEKLKEVEKARYFRYEEHPMYTMRESELIQRFLKEHGRMPELNEEMYDLF